MVCPANSYYDFCGPPCPATCASLNAPAPCACQCTAGCFCCQGFALKAASACGTLPAAGPSGRWGATHGHLRPEVRGPQAWTPTRVPPSGLRAPRTVPPAQGCLGLRPMRYRTFWLCRDPHLHTFSGTRHQCSGLGWETLTRTCCHTTPPPRPLSGALGCHVGPAGGWGHGRMAAVTAGGTIWGGPGRHRPTHNEHE